MSELDEVRAVVMQILKALNAATTETVVSKDDTTNVVTSTISLGGDVTTTYSLADGVLCDRHDRMVGRVLHYRADLLASLTQLIKLGAMT